MKETLTAIPDQYTLMLENYASIVEKTNQQLSLWSNPYGIMIGILTLLVAVGAIVVSIILVTNSQDQKKRQQEFFNEQERIINERNNREDTQRKEHYEKAEKKFEDLINEQQKKLASTNKEGKQKIEQEIEELKKQKASIGLYKDPVKIFYDSNFSFSDIATSLRNRPEIHKMFCLECGKSFEYYEENKNPWSVDYIPLSYTSTVSNKKVHCPHCNTINVAK